MNYAANEDKWDFDNKAPLYNDVLGRPVFSSEGSEPLSLEDAKAWGKIDQDADDDIISSLITAARRICENYSGIGFITRTVVVNINNSNGGFKLPYGPVTNTPTAVDFIGDAIELTYNMGQIQWPFGNMTVTYNAGYSSLPADLLTALKAQVLFLYENRGEGTTGISPVAKMILEPLREVV